MTTPSANHQEQWEKRIMITSVTDLKENDAQWAQKHNARLMREHMEEKKREEEETARCRKEWQETPLELKTCLACGLRLDQITIARIGEFPSSPRRHSFCDSTISDVIPGLVGLLRQVFVGEEIPLDSLRQVIGAWENQRGLCGVSKIKLAFPVERKRTEKTTKDYSSSVISHIDQAVMNLRDNEEREKAARHAELHTPVLNYSESGELRLLSKTVA